MNLGKSLKCSITLGTSDEDIRILLGGDFSLLLTDVAWSHCEKLLTKNRIPIRCIHEADFKTCKVTTTKNKITVSNAAGTAAASSIDVDDDLPSEVSYVTHGDDGNAWTITKSGVSPENINATKVSLAAGASAYFWIEVTIN